MFECYICGLIFPAKNLGSKEAMVTYWHEKKNIWKIDPFLVNVFKRYKKTNKLSLKGARISAGAHSCIYCSNSVEQFI